jgi:hypothetical protein
MGSPLRVPYPEETIVGAGGLGNLAKALKREGTDKSFVTDGPGPTEGRPRADRGPTGGGIGGPAPSA